MRKPRAARSIFLEIPGEEGRFVTPAKAQFLQARQLAVFVSDTRLRQLPHAEALIRYRAASAAGRDDAYWRRVAEQRGGTNLRGILFTKVDIDGYAVTQIRMVADG